MKTIIGRDKNGYSSIHVETEKPLSSHAVLGYEPTERVMKRIETEVVHSKSKTAWNVIGKTPGMKYKIARIPYVIDEGMEKANTRNKAEALKHAEFISYCFNNVDIIK